MFYIYTKDKKSQVVFTVNLTAAEVKNFMDNNLFLDYPELDQKDYVVVERNEAFKNATYDPSTNSIREMTRQELIEEEIEVQLNQGEYIENKKLITVPQPTSYHTWNPVSHEWDIDMNGVKKLLNISFKLFYWKNYSEVLNIKKKFSK